MSKVSRSVYQKVCEENKRLLRDIKILVSKELDPNKVILMVEYRERFEKEERFRLMMKEVAKQYIKDHADELPDFLTKGIKN